jgi:predicted transcriptional regulator
MASEAKQILDDDQNEAVDLATVSPEERAVIQQGLDDLDAGRWLDHAVVKADIAAMRAELTGQ